MPTGHFDLDMLEDDSTAVVALAEAPRHEADLRALYSRRTAAPKTAAGYRKLGKRLGAIGEWARGEGYGFGWHNHDFEFVKLADR